MFVCVDCVAGPCMKLSFLNDKVRDVVFVSVQVPNNGDDYVSGPGMELSFHDGTVRDVVFMQDMSNHTSLLISGGAGDCKIYASDCETGTPIRALSGHGGQQRQA